jgi:predicted metal-dependent HD superfamily phosphohydrolase
MSLVTHYLDYNFPWSRIQHTELAVAARKYIYEHTQKEWATDHFTVILRYHNLDHVASMYEYLEKSSEPYNEELDWAILFHDIVYDNKPDKELRSSQLFYEMSKKYRGINFNTVSTLNVGMAISATIDHVIHEHSSPIERAIVRADLHGLADSVTTFYNFGKLMEEAVSLYGISQKEFAENSRKFMTGMMDRVRDNRLYDREYSDFYSQVLQGIDSTIVIAQAMCQD